MPDDADLAFAQQIVVEYVRTLERHLTEQNLPAPVDSPFAKAAILNAIETSVTFLSSTSALTDELREYFVRYSASYIPKRHGPHEPAVKNLE